MISPGCTVFNDFINAEKFIAAICFYKRNTISIICFTEIIINYFDNSIAVILNKIDNVIIIDYRIKPLGIIIRIKYKPNVTCFIRIGICRI